MIPLASIPSGVLIAASSDPACIARFGLFIAVILIVSSAVGLLAQRFLNIPHVAGMIIGGILCGPSLLNIAQWPLFATLQPLIDFQTGTHYSLISSDLFITGIGLISATFSIPLLLWIAGHETEISDLAHVGFVAIIAGILGAVLPIIGIGWVLAYGTSWNALPAYGMGIIFAATSVSIPVAILISYKKMHLKSSKATLGAAIIDDIVAIILLSLFFLLIHNNFFGSTTLSTTAHHSPSLLNALGAMAGSFVCMFIIGIICIPRFLRSITRHHHETILPLVALVIMIIYAAFAELVGGLAAITGAYFAGLFYRMGDPDHHSQKIIAPFVHTILLPLFLASIGLQVNLSLLSIFDWAMVALILLLSIITKMGACWIATSLDNLKNKDPWSGIETYLFGASMVARGEVGLVVATIMYGSHILDDTLYNSAIIIIVLTTIITPLLLTRGFAWLTLAKQSIRPTYRKVIPALSIVDTNALFTLLKEHIHGENHHIIATHTNDGDEVISIDEDDTKIILSPLKEITFEGKEETIKSMLEVLKKTIERDHTALNVP